MKFNLNKLFNHRRFRVVAFGGMVCIAAITPIRGSYGQNASSDGAIYMPLVATGGHEDAATQHAPHEHAHIGHIIESGRFTVNTDQEMAWPPQLKQIENMAWDDGVMRIYAAQRAEAESVAAVATQDAGVRTLLGERFTLISAVPIEEKWQNTIYGNKVTYFSYSNNITVEAVIEDGAVKSVKRYAAAEYQPPLSRDEVDAAILIARKYWLDQGVARVNELEGFTIQTFQPAGDGGYYETRMTYVSFHVDETSDPELLAWVDLTEQTVVKAVVDRGGE